MCIAILSTAHPADPFILLSNRDEVLARPTLRANWWDAPASHVLGGRDTQRAERGTWLGITRDGRLAVLTNFREPDGKEPNRAKSRGAFPAAWLAGAREGEGDSDEGFAQRLMEEVGIDDVGGFTLLFGRLRAGKGRRRSSSSTLSATQTSPPPSSPSYPGLALLSNRSTSASTLPRIATHPNETHALSNSHFGDRAWPKVVAGEQHLAQAIADDVAAQHSSKENFIETLFSILNIDTLPSRLHDQYWHVYTRNMRRSIFISPNKGVPPAAEAQVEQEAAAMHAPAPPSSIFHPDHPAPSSSTPGVALPPHEPYGTHKQTVILVDTHGRVTFVERTLFDEHGAAIPREDQTREFTFPIEGWWDEADPSASVRGSADVPVAAQGGDAHSAMAASRGGAVQGAALARSVEGPDVVAKL